MSGITDSGFVSESAAEIEAKIATDQRSLISPTIDTSPSGMVGALDRVFAGKLAEVWNLGAGLYGAAFTDDAEGYPLTLRAAMTGTLRRAATHSRVTGTCTLSPGTYAAGSLLASNVDDATARFASIEDATNEGTVDAPIDVVFRAERTGAVRCDAGKLTVIASPLTGFSAVTNADDASLGAGIETDAALRVRRRDELRAAGSTTLAAIRGDLLRDVAGVVSCTILENDTSSTDANGLPGHSIECIVYGPTPATGADDQAVAEQIYASKAGAIGTYGSTSRTVIGARGEDVTVRFTRPSDLDAYVSVTITVDADTYAGDAAVQAAMAAAVADLGAGAVLRWTKLVGVPYSVAGVLRVDTFGMSTNPVGPFLAADITPTVRQIVRLEAGDVAVST